MSMTTTTASKNIATIRTSDDRGNRYGVQVADLAEAQALVERTCHLVLTGDHPYRTEWLDCTTSPSGPACRVDEWVTRSAHAFEVRTPGGRKVWGASVVLHEVRS